MIKQNEFPVGSNKPFHSKYRPTSFQNIVGQEHVVSYFKKSISSNRINFAYLFLGKHGVGKTTLSRIIAKTLNCHNILLKKNCEPCNYCTSCIAISHGKSFDVHEFNAALNTGIDNIRDIIEKIQFTPVNGKYKICIIDEVHMLSPNAFNALLKVLEEPPKNVLFILATTDIKRIPNTIVSRCHRLCFLSLSKTDLAIAITTVIWLEKGNITNKALTNILNFSKGSFRDALNATDMLITQNKFITQNSFSSLFTEIPYSISQLFLQYLILKNAEKLLMIYIYIQEKEWLPSSVINQLQELLQDQIISCSQLSFNNCYYLSLWQLLSKYKSYDFSQDLLSSFMSEALYLISIAKNNPHEESVFTSKKSIPFHMKVNNVSVY